MLHSKYKIADESIVLEGNKVIENSGRLNFYKLKHEKKTEETESNDNKLDEPSVNNDIYMLAFAAQLNPDEIEPGPGYIEKMQLIGEERSALFVCAMKVATIQMSSACLIFLFFVHGNNG